VFAGVDIGSVTTKAVLLDDRLEVRAFEVAPTASDRDKSGTDCLAAAVRSASISAGEISRIFTTGYGRRAMSGIDRAVPEIVCHARGTHFMIPEARTIFDIGGQDSKVIELDDNGMTIRFEMNDKCAAGTGRFLEVLTERLLGLELSELGPVSLKATDPCSLSSVCTVFAESEIVSLLSEGRTREDIAAGMHQAIARRLTAMGKAAQIGCRPAVVFSGGVALNVGVCAALEAALGTQLIVPDRPQITAALGAALMASD